MLNIAGNKKKYCCMLGAIHITFMASVASICLDTVKEVPRQIWQWCHREQQSKRGPIFYYVCSISQTYMLSIPNTKSQKEEKSAAHCIKCKKLQVSLFQHGPLFCVRYSKCIRLGSTANVVQSGLFAPLFPMALRRYAFFMLSRWMPEPQNMMRMGLAGLCTRS